MMHLEPAAVINNEYAPAAQKAAGDARGLDEDLKTKEKALAVRRMWTWLRVCGD